MQHLLDIFHAVGYAVSDGGRDGRFVVAEDEPRFFERSQALRQHSCRDTFHLSPEYAEAHGAVVTQRP